MALDYRLDPEKIAGEQAVAQGPLDDRRLLAILRVLESISPLHGEVVLRVVRQAYAYLKRDEVADAVDAKVRSSLETGPCIVVAHSLGTVVAFKLLRAQTQDVPLFVSLGSPLGLMSVQSALKRPRVKPSGVGRWYNGLDPNDLVTLGKSLTSETFAPDIINKVDIDNGDEPHWIERYLQNADVRREIGRELAKNILAW
jgi:pimeloyl-ACP methyl ester carboxylesterase